MSNISTIYDTLRTALTAKLSGKTEIPNPYSLEDNMVQFLENGWGLTIDDGAPGSIDVYCLDSESRNFTLILTKILYNLDGTNTRLIADSKTLLENIRAARNDLLAYDKLATDSIQKIDFVGASGIQFLPAEKFSVIYATLTIGVEYVENILKE